MAPIEIDFGSQKDVTGKKVFVNDNGGSVLIDPDKSTEEEYSSDHGQLNLEGMCDSEDNGGFVKYSFVETNASLRVGHVRLFLGSPNYTEGQSVVTKTKSVTKLFKTKSGEVIGFTARYKRNAH